MDKKSVGKISHYFGKIGVAIVELTGELKIGDKISIEKGERKLEQSVNSIQIEHKNVESAKAGDSIGLKVDGKVAEGSEVFVVTE